jgi:hypothetical protein
MFRLAEQVDQLLAQFVQHGHIPCRSLIRLLKTNDVDCLVVQVDAGDGIPLILQLQDDLLLSFELILGAFQVCANRVDQEA